MNFSWLEETSYRNWNKHYLPKRNKYHNREDFFVAKQTEDETSEEFWRRVLKSKKNAISTGIRPKNY